MIGRTARAFAIGGLALASFAGAMPAHAQDADTSARVKKLEAEVRALQRRVFPGSDGKYFEPEIGGQPAQPANPAGAASTSALTDVLARLDALESQLQRLTAQYEEGSNTLRLLSDRVAILEKAGAPAQPDAGVPAQLPDRIPVPSGAAPSSVGSSLTPASVTKPAPSVTTPAPAATGPSAARVAAVKEILKPQTNDAGDDEYTYGFRLWDAKFYPEAQQQLALYLDKYPTHSKVSYARNLLGRAYLDDGKAKEAAPWFLKNYQADKNGERAGDSLLFLSETMIALKDTKRACIALAEFSEKYPALAAGRLASQYDADRKKVKCN